MTAEIEKEFCDLFLNARYSERVFFELTSKKKRRNGLSRFAHNCKDILNSDRIRRECGGMLSSEETKEFLGYGKCYCICIDKDFDGEFADINNAVEALYGYGPYILYNAEKKKAFIETEYDFSEHWVYFVS
ncbi:MAG: hypothetical protein IJZ72_04535 [Oscillospiraceae bacterium]|nr:hypothetical protein [Oscillospiraceae bacterium]